MLTLLDYLKERDECDGPYFLLPEERRVFGIIRTPQDWTVTYETTELTPERIEKLQRVFEDSDLHGWRRKIMKRGLKVLNGQKNYVGQKPT